MALYKNIPKVDKVLGWPLVQQALTVYSRPLVLKAVRATLDACRADMATEMASAQTLSEEHLTKNFVAELQKLSSSTLKRVVNGTGVVVHTNLGRSLLAEDVRDTLNNVAFCYSNLEFDLEKGERGTRYSLVEPLLCELTGAEAALVVNNNAAAVMLALTSLSHGKEVVVSRGELVEIGGSFRIPDVMRLSGAVLREVGTTNRTHLHDYRDAVTHDTSLFLKVHTSNFAVVGFTAEVTAVEMVEIGKEYSIPVMADIGSGCLIDFSKYGLPGETTVQEYVKADIDVITFSGDKMLGGPQVGIIVGKKIHIDAMKKHQLLRALRVDKMTLAALEGTLRLYRDDLEALSKIPTLRMLTATATDLEKLGKSVLKTMRRALPDQFSLKLEHGFSQVGGGALPLLQIPSILIMIEAAGISSQKLEQHLRMQNVPVIGRINKGQFLLDLRTLLDDDVPFVIAALRTVPFDIPPNAQ